MAKVFKFLTPRRALPFFNSPRLSDFPCSPSQCCCCCRFGAEKLKTMRIPLAALLRLEWTYFSLPSLVFFLGGSPCFFFFVLLRKFYIFSVGITEGLEYIYIWQLAALSGLRCYGGAAGSSRARRRGWSKNLLLVLKFLILCYLAAQTICCQWEYPKRRERERESDRDRGEREGERAVL